MNYIIICFLSLFSITTCLVNSENKQFYDKNNIMNKNSNLDTIIFGAGCFWCVEAVFQQVNGVIEVIPGYCNGFTENPSYKEVCSGNSGHVEVARVVFDTSLVNISYLFEVFWKTHDPTTLNRQGNDVGTQYRSGIYCLNDDQLNLAIEYMQALDNEKVWNQSIVTEIKMLDVFYEAENYHHNYYNNNKNQGYCQFIIKPKLDKFNNVFGTLNNKK
jgi:peptide-methionine (S)-S-oxide reductase